MQSQTRKAKFWLNIMTGQIKKAHKNFPDSYAFHKPEDLYQPIGMFYHYTVLAAELKDAVWYIHRKNDLNVLIVVKTIPAATILEPLYFEKIIAGRVSGKLLGNKSKAWSDLLKASDLKNQKK